MSFIHIVTFKWKFPDQSAKAAAAADALRAFVADLDGVESYLCGSDTGLSPSSHDFAVVGTFTTQADFEDYRDHPQHQRIISEQIAPILGDRTVVHTQELTRAPTPTCALGRDHREQGRLTPDRTG